MTQPHASDEAVYSWAFLRDWALDFLIEYMTKGRSAALRMSTAIDEQRLDAGNWDARDAVQYLIGVISEPVGSVLDLEHEREYFARCAPVFASQMEPRSIVVECSRILLKMEERTELATRRGRASPEAGHLR